MPRRFEGVPFPEDFFDENTGLKCLSKDGRTRFKALIDEWDPEEISVGRQ